MLLEGVKRTKSTSFSCLTKYTTVGSYLNRQLCLSMPKKAFPGNQVRSAKIPQTSYDWYLANPMKTYWQVMCTVDYFMYILVYSLIFHSLVIELLVIEFCAHLYPMLSCPSQNRRLVANSYHFHTVSFSSQNLSWKTYRMQFLLIKPDCQII